MDYDGLIIRPPSEANSIILQVTVGCSHNGCTFCGAYKEKKFSVRSETQIMKDLDFAARYCRRQSRVFLADGDALILPFPRLKQIFNEIRYKVPWVRRISLYGNAKAIRSKTVEELEELKTLGLDRIYLGLESGCDRVLDEVKKGETAESMIAAAQKVKKAGVFLSVTVLLGLGQVSQSHIHASETASTLNGMHPRQIAALTLMPLDNTELGRQCLNGEFVLPDAEQMLQELKILVAGIDCSCQFQANHASNYLPITGRMPRDKERILSEIEDVLKDKSMLRPEYLRSL